MLNLTTLPETLLELPLASLQEAAAMVVLALFCVFATIELLFPRDLMPAKTLRRSYLTNLLLFVANGFLVSLLSVTPLFLLAAHFAGHGLLAWFPNMFWQALFALVFLDLLLYVWHRFCHQWNWLWMFHRVHHNDAALNSSTAFRIHILELLGTTMVKAGYIILLGIDQLMYLVNEVLLTGFIIFHHSNIRFSGERWLGRVLIVPALHKAHHSTKRNEHDRNYGAIFSFWDRWFGTFTDAKPAKLGISGRSPQNCLGLVKFGFTPICKLPALPANLEAMIAEAAYYKAEKRNFNPGDEVRDWLEAKTDIIKQLHGDNKACRYWLSGN